MMTGYGYNPNLVQQPPILQGVNEEWGPVMDQSSYYPGGSGTTALSNAHCYGSTEGWYQSPCFSFSDGPSSSNAMSAAPAVPSTSHPFHLLQNPSLAPPPPHPRVSISDEELYQALNMSPHPTTSTSGYQLQHPQTTDYLTSDVCFPSTSSYESSGCHDHGAYAPPTGFVEDSHHLPEHDGDDEQSGGEEDREHGRYDSVSPTFSIHSFAPTTSTNTAEAEDLEVELINHLKAAPRYQLPDDIDIFLHTGTTDDTEYCDEDSRPTTTYSHHSNKAPSPPAPRPAYAKKLTAGQHPKPETSIIIPDVSKTAPLFLQTSGSQDPSGFTPLLTPNSDALLHKKLNENPISKAGPTYPAFPQPTSSSQFVEDQAQFPDYNQGALYFPTNLNTHRFDYLYSQPEEQDILPLLLDTFKPLPPPQITSVPVTVPVNIPERLTSTKKVPKQVNQPAAPIKTVRLSDQELESQSQALAIDVISNLFTSKKEIIDRAAVINAPKKPVARNLFCNDKESLEKAKSDKPINMNVLDDWETADDDDLAGRMENLLKDVKKEEMKKPTLPKPSFPPQQMKNSDWDSNTLPHVLEIFGVPDYKMQEDVVKAMETIGFGDCKVQWQERKVVLAVFDSVARAKNCLTLAKHEWLRFRALSDAPKTVQDFAKTNASSLTMPKKKQQTTATVARRMIESALGKKANVTVEKRQEERNQLAAARAAKKNTVQWD